MNNWIMRKMLAMEKKVCVQTRLEGKLVNRLKNLD